MDAYVPASRAIFASEVQKSGCNICVAVGNCRAPQVGARSMTCSDVVAESHWPSTQYQQARFGVAIAKMGRKNRDLERSSGLTIACSRADKISAALARENFTIVRDQPRKKEADASMQVLVRRNWVEAKGNLQHTWCRVGQKLHYGSCESEKFTRRSSGHKG